jgi:hypothetical protein
MNVTAQREASLIWTTTSLQRQENPLKQIAFPNSVVYRNLHGDNDFPALTSLPASTGMGRSQPVVLGSVKLKILNTCQF